MNSRLVHLDFARGLAAVAVCAGHLRAFQFSTFTQVPKPNWFDKIFYLVTGYGHQAVVVFFVLSGFLVGGSVAKSTSKNRWSWFDYGLRRLTRLWLVLIPALVLTWMWDSAGGFLTGGLGYNGCYYGSLQSGPPQSAGTQLGPAVFFGNLFFLQTIFTPVYGTNGPLWSLANEFWYYLLFPLLYLVFYTHTSLKHKIVYCLIAIACCILLPSGLLLGGLIWLVGYGVHLCVSLPRLRRITAIPIFFAVSFTALIASLWISRNHVFPGSDMVVGLTFAGILPFLVIRQSGSVWYQKMATGFSAISYTLYLVHFPLLAFLFFAFRLPGKDLPSVNAYLVFFVILLCVLAFASAVWWLFERRTDQLRKGIECTIQGLRNTSMASK